MADRIEELQERIAAYTALNAAADREFTEIRTLMQQVEAGERETVPMLLELAETAGKSEQARHGQLIQTLAQAQRVKASRREGFSTWLATHLDMTPGKARGVDQSAREIGDSPVLTEALSSGDVGADSVRVLTRATKAVKNTSQDKGEVLTEMLDVVAREGISAARRRVQILEETLEPGQAERKLARQRERSFLRFIELDSGMWRIEAVLDAERATLIHTAIDAHVSAWIRSRQYDHVEMVPEDVRSIEQLQAEALTRLATLFQVVEPKQRDVPFNPITVYAKEIHPAGANLVLTNYGQLLPDKVATPLGQPGAHVIELENGQPVRIDGKPIDLDPTARLASKEQRMALGYRDKTCTHPGCDRPLTWSPHAHHKIPYSQGGATTVENLVLLCPEHHTQAHRDPQQSG